MKKKSERRKITKKELKQIFEDHRKWIKSETKEGKKADLSDANLNDADLNDASLGRTVFANVDLSMVKGLDKAEHHIPSSIGVDTIYMSEGKIPEVFYRGAGLDENFINHIPSFVNQPIQFYSCFISYSHDDRKFARRLVSTNCFQR